MRSIAMMKMPSCGGAQLQFFYDALLLLNTPEHLPMWKVFVVCDTINGEKTGSIVFV
jgi:hypothetical protein